MSNFPLVDSSKKDDKVNLLSAEHSVPPINVMQGPEPRQPGPDQCIQSPLFSYPVTVQPQKHLAGNLNWMPAPVGVAKCPPGLEYLTAIDQILVHQQVELLEALTGFETENKYILKNSLGQQVYMAAESSSCCQRMCCSSLREFDMKIMDNFQNHLIHFNRPLACQSCCFPCCLQTMEVSTPPGVIIGTVKQTWSILRPHYDIEDASGNVVLKIVGPICKMSICCNDVVFRVFGSDGETHLLGNITKQWSGFVKEHFSDADNFSVTFPMDLDVKIKAILLGACFLIDFMYFEEKQQSRGDSCLSCSNATQLLSICIS